MNTAPVHPATAAHTISKHNTVMHPGHTKKDYAITAKALDYGRLSLSPVVSRTYRVLSDLDFADHSTRRCKGYIWHRPETIAECIGRSERTIQRHLAALERAQLVVRQRRGSTTVIRLNVLTASAVPVVDNTYPQTTKVSSLYKGNLETIRITNTKQLQSLDALRRYEAKFDDVVVHLVSLGYDLTQAVNDFVEFGREELQQQIDNLYAYLRCGKHFHSYAKWLNWAIRAHHRTTPQVQQEASEAWELATRKTIRYEQVIDEESQTVHLVAVDDEEGKPAFNPQKEALEQDLATPRDTQKTLQNRYVSLMIFTHKFTRWHGMMRRKGRAFSYPSTNPTHNPSNPRSCKGVTNAHQPPLTPHPASLVARSSSFDHTPTAENLHQYFYDITHRDYP